MVDQRYGERSGENPHKLRAAEADQRARTEQLLAMFARAGVSNDAVSIVAKPSDAES